MEYYVYENYPTSAATVHASPCRIYVGRIADITQNGKWHGPFADRESACKFAKATGRRNVKCCYWCRNQ